MSYYIIEGIVNYPNLEAGTRLDKKTQTQVADATFSMQLLLGDNAKPKLKAIKEYVKKTYPNAQLNVNDIVEKEQEILGKEYKKRVTLKGWASFTKFLDFYKEKFDPATLQSGDKVLIQLKIIQVSNESKAPGKKFIRLIPHIVTIVEKGSYQLYDPDASFEEKNNEYFEDVKKYKKEEEIMEGIDKKEGSEESEEW